MAAYKVTWVDTRFYDGWHLSEDVPKMQHATVVSRGEILHEGRHTVVMVLSVSNVSSVSDCIAIPKRAILRREIIGGPSPAHDVEK